MHKAVKASSRDLIVKIDPISPLPDDVLYHILSFLDIFDAVGAGLLSKRWGLLCSRLPFLDIDIPKLCNQRNLRLDRELCHKFAHFISWVLTSRSAVSIIRLRLTCVRCIGIFSREQIFRWMCAAARRNVQELIVIFDPSDVLHMPFSLVSGHSLQILELNLFGQALQLPSSPGFLHLKFLCLKDITLTDEDLTRSFFSGCQLLNKLVLSIRTFENIKVLDISSSSIEHLFFEDCAFSEGYDKIDLKISCPKLLAFKYDAPAPRQYIFEGMSSLETMHIHPSEVFEPVSSDVLAACVYEVLKMAHNIVELKLGLDIILGLCEMGDKFRCNRCSFHGLKALNLWITVWYDYLRFLSLLLKHCHNLEALTLYLDGESADATLSKMEDLSKITCLRSTINTIHLMNFKGEDDEIAFAKSLLECGLVLKKFVVYWSTEPEWAMNDEVVEVISRFPKSSASAQVVFVDPDSSISFDGWLSM